MAVKRGAKVLIIDPADMVLVLRRSGTHPHIPYTPDLPGGEIESGESAIDAACREVFEETNITLRPEDTNEVGMQTHRAFDTDYELYLFLAKVTERPEVTISWEHDKYDWVAVEEVNNLDDGFQPLLDSYRNARKN